VKTIFNNWFIKYLVIFVFLGILLYGYSIFFKPEPYYYTQYSTDNYHYLIKVDKETGEVYRFGTSTGNRVWKLLNE
jgi:hypothetical protein